MEDAAALRRRCAVLESVGARLSHLAVLPSGRSLALFVDCGGSVPDWTAAMTAAQYRNAAAAAAKKGWIPLRVSAKDSGSRTRFAAIFAPNVPRHERTFRAAGPVSVPAIDAAMEDYIKSNGLRGTALAIVDRTRLVYAKGYTWAESDYPIVQPATLFRQASLAKTFTTLALYRLVQDMPGIALETTMQSILQLRAPGGRPPADARFGDITLRHLLEGTSGLSDGLILRTVEVAAAANAKLPATSEQMASFAAAQRMRGAPGDQKHVTYSNAGYFLAGRVLVRLRNAKTFMDALAPLLTPLQVTRVRLSPSLAANQGPDEARYHTHDLAIAASVHSPSRPPVAAQYGGSNREASEGTGGLSAAVIDVARIAAMLALREGNPVFSSASYDALFENAATATDTLTKPNKHGYYGFHGFDRVTRVSGPAPRYRGRKGGWLRGSQSALAFDTGGISIAFASNCNNREGARADWETRVREIAEKYRWPEGDLFARFGMAPLGSS